jgi:uncharacterized protein YndB with AHSA1/START domain
VVTIELHVDRPVDEVFDYFSDFRNENEWNVVAHDLVLLTEGAVGTGSRFRGEYDRMGTMQYEITKFERPGRVEVRGSAKQFAWDSTFTFSPENGGTRMVGPMDTHPKGLMKLLAPFMSGVVRRQTNKGMASFKRTIEAKAPAARA